MKIFYYYAVQFEVTPKLASQITKVIRILYKLCLHILITFRNLKVNDVVISSSHIVKYTRFLLLIIHHIAYRNLLEFNRSFSHFSIWNKLNFWAREVLSYMNAAKWAYLAIMEEDVDLLANLASTSEPNHSFSRPTTVWIIRHFSK